MHTTHAMRVAQARRFSNSTLTETSSEKHIFLVRCSDLPPGLSKEANARDFEGRDLNKRVYRDVRDTLTGSIGVPGTFDLLNKGITIVADSVRRLNDGEYEVVIDDGQGIVDGGHTYDIICDTREKTQIPDNQFVEVRIITGIPKSWIVEIAMGLKRDRRQGSSRPISTGSMDGWRRKWRRRDSSTHRLARKRRCPRRCQGPHRNLGGLEHFRLPQRQWPTPGGSLRKVVRTGQEVCGRF